MTVMTGKFLIPLLIWMTCFVQNSAAQVPVILDTDIGSDCDDAGALAVLNALADRGEAKILGVIYSSGANPYGVGVCDAIDTYYGRGDVPLGQYPGSDVGDPMDHYSRVIATDKSRFPHDVVDSATSLVKAYRKILEKQPDSSVTLITIGHPNGLRLLMRDPMSLSLIKRKVARWVAMAYAGTTPQRDWNFGRNGAENAIDTVLRGWPTPRYFCSLGKTIITGNRRLPKTSQDNPVREAYRLWNNALQTGRYSWDPLTVLFAIRPAYFRVDTLGELVQNDEFQTWWNKEHDKSGEYRVTSFVMSRDSMENIVEGLMSASPKLRLKH